jgi:CHAT domain-containing protein
VERGPAPARLHGWIIAPLQQDLAAAGARTLMFALDGALRYVPMAVLHDGNQYLAERYAVALYTEAARDKLQQVPAVKEWAATGLGLTAAHAGFSELPSVAGELRAVIRTAASPQGALPGQAFLDRAFTQDRLRDALESGHAVLHIASHFQFGPGTDADSFLLLGDGSRLTLADMRTMQFPLELLTLSACQTAVGDRGSRDADGREVEGFAVLAQRQGAAAVLATLWSVADASTGAFMQELYRLKVQSPALSKADALRQVQQAFIAGRITVPGAGPARGARLGGAPGERAARYAHDAAAPFAHPFFWGPFVLMGNWL